MCKSKTKYRTQESRIENCSYTSIPSCDREILLVLTVILFIISQNNTTKYCWCQNKYSPTKYCEFQNEDNTKRCDKYKNKSSKKKDDIIKSDIISTEMNEASSEVFDKDCDNEINLLLPIINQFDDTTGSNTLLQHDNMNDKNCDKEVTPMLPIINQFDDTTGSNTLLQHDNMNDKNCNKEVAPISLPIEINKHPEEISTPDCFIKNNILLINKSNSSDIDTREKHIKTLVPLAAMLKNDYRGVMVCALLPNGITISGEVAFNFNGIVALKYNNRIIFINENYIISFY